jgi:uncharacterized membrane protein (DUF485 family)
MSLRSRRPYRESSTGLVLAPLESTTIPPPTEVAFVSNDALDSTDDANVALQNSAEFIELRRKFRRFVFPMTAFFLVWYFLYVLLSVYAKEFMGTRVIGNITWGLILGLLQFVTTFAITMYYARWADREFDTGAEALARKMGGAL